MKGNESDKERERERERERMRTKCRFMGCECEIHVHCKICNTGACENHTFKHEWLHPEERLCGKCLVEKMSIGSPGSVSGSLVKCSMCNFFTLSAGGGGIVCKYCSPSPS